MQAPRSIEESKDAIRGAEQGTLVVVAGGDGTINQAAGILGESRPLGVIPFGTANDLARELGVPRDPVAAARALVESETDRHVDLVDVDGRAFCTVGGIGLVSRTTAAVLRMKQRPGVTRRVAEALGSGVYKVAAAASILAGRGMTDRLAIDYVDPEGRPRRWAGDAHTLFVANHRMCGGGLCLPTGSNGRDGRFELAIVHRSSRPALALNFSRLSAGARIPPHVVEVLPARAARIALEAPATFVADGEVLGAGTAFEVRIRPGALRVRGIA